nr:translation initiation factor IF-2 [Oryctolagus cuniculus]
MRACTTGSRPAKTQAPGRVACGVDTGKPDVASALPRLGKSAHTPNLKSRKDSGSHMLQPELCTVPGELPATASDGHRPGHRGHRERAGGCSQDLPRQARACSGQPRSTGCSSARPSAPPGPCCMASQSSQRPCPWMAARCGPGIPVASSAAVASPGTGQPTGSTACPRQDAGAARLGPRHQPALGEHLQACRTSATRLGPTGSTEDRRAVRARVLVRAAGGAEVLELESVSSSAGRTLGHTSWRFSNEALRTPQGRAEPAPQGQGGHRQEALCPEAWEEHPGVRATVTAFRAWQPQKYCAGAGSPHGSPGAGAPSRG